MKQDEVVLQDQSSRLSKGKLLIIFAALQLALFLSFLDGTSVSTAAPIIARELKASDSITWLGSAFLLANTSFQIVTSRLSDIWGRKIVLFGSLGLFVLGDFLAGFARNAVWLYCCRAVAGIGGGGINSLSMIIMSDVVSMRERGKYQGLLGIAISLGSAVGPFVGAAFSEKVTWRWVFWITTPLGVVTMAIIWFLLPLTAMKGDTLTKLKQMDWVGTVLALAMTTCFLVPLSGGGSARFPWDGSVVIGLFVASAVALVAFVVVEGYFARLPLLPGRLFKNRNVCLLLVQTWLVGIVFYGNIYYVPLFAQNVLGMSAIMSAVALLPLVLVQTFTTVISGFVVKRTAKTKSSFLVGFVLWFAGQCGQLCFKRTTSIGVIVGVLFVQGAGLGATLQSTLVLAQASGPNADRAVVTGARNFARTSGGAIAIAIGNAILNNVFAKNLPATLPAELATALKTDFTIPSTVTAAQRDAILDAYMLGLRDVFIFFVPVLGLCLLMCFFLEDISLDQPEPPITSGDATPDEEKTLEFDASANASTSTVKEESPRPKDALKSTRAESKPSAPA